MALREAVRARNRRLKSQYAHLDFGNDDEPKYQLPILEELLKLNSGNYRYYAEAGDLHLMLKDFSSAVAYFTVALQLVDYYPDDPWWHQNVRFRHILALYHQRALAFMSLKDYQKAVEDFEMMFRLDPTLETFGSQSGVTILMILCCRGAGNDTRADELTKSINPDLLQYTDMYMDLAESRQLFVDFSRDENQNDVDSVWARNKQVWRKEMQQVKELGEEAVKAYLQALDNDLNSLSPTVERLLNDIKNQQKRK
jgi:tetratricopeptide (TPR) repeat protein